MQTIFIDTGIILEDIAVKHPINLFKFPTGFIILIKARSHESLFFKEI